MPRFAANLSMLYGEHAFLERFEAAASDGFRGVEYLFPYAYDERELAEKLRSHRLEQVLFNLPAGSWESGERGIACLPDRVDEFREGVARAARYARALGASRVNCLAGIAGPNVLPKDAHRTLVENVRFAADELANVGATLLVEPVNTRDVPGFFISRSDAALALIAEAGRGNVRLQYDAYHMQRMEGELAATIEKNLAHIAHVQVADNPGRHEPGTGEINYAFLFERLDALGYDGWVGCEYIPLTKTSDGLRWLSEYRQTAGSSTK